MIPIEITIEKRLLNNPLKSWKWVDDGNGNYEMKKTGKGERVTDKELICLESIVEDIRDKLRQEAELAKLKPKGLDHDRPRTPRTL